jgi:hypothetical protein
LFLGCRMKGLGCCVEDVGCGAVGGEFRVLC